ncbi:MAG: peptidoglycan editing factor PgeF [Dissulfurispiraceae bacterium]
MTSDTVVPDIFKSREVRGFFTTKAVDGDLKALSKMVKVPLSHIYLPIQEHTDRVMVLGYDLKPQIADAVITRRRGVLIGVQVADCVPILLHEGNKGAIGVVHAGWKGTAGGILKKTISKMSEKFCSSPSDMAIAIGPSIGLCCYEVGPEVIEVIRRATGEGEYLLKKGQKYCLDLSAANKCQAVSLGVPSRNIWISDECTSCRPEKYYSYRYSKGTTGRQAGFIGFL